MRRSAAYAELRISSQKPAAQTPLAAVDDAAFNATEDPMAETSAKGAAKGVETLREGLRGELVLPQDAAYESARRIWNAMIDKRPAAIVRCGAVTDVVRAVEFARASGMPLAVRG